MTRRRKRAPVQRYVIAWSEKWAEVFRFFSEDMTPPTRLNVVRGARRMTVRGMFHTADGRGVEMYVRCQNSADSWDVVEEGQRHSFTIRGKAVQV